MLEMDVQMKMGEIKIEPLSVEQKNKIVQESFGDITQLTSENIALFLARLQITIRQYLIEYETNWRLFEQSFQLMNKISNLNSGDNVNSAYMRLRNQQGHKNYAENFIRTLEKGSFLLDYIRHMLTNQKINTNFTIKGADDEVYYVDKSEVSYKLVLSTYGASGNNFVSLAYDLDVDSIIAQLKQSASEVPENNKSIKGTDIYKRIMQVKEEYLLDLEKKAAARGDIKNYPRRYDATDAEIFDLMKQRLKDGDITSLNRALTMTTYRKMRKTMGGRGGYRTSATQLGDVGLTQDKMVTHKIQQVNFARQTLIHNRFKAMDTALTTLDKNTIKQAFLSMFTEKQSRVGDNISKMANREAQKMIRELFK